MMLIQCWKNNKLWELGGASKQSLKRLHPPSSSSRIIMGLRANQEPHVNAGIAIVGSLELPGLPLPLTKAHRGWFA